jgi:transposase-like protein
MTLTHFWGVGEEKFDTMNTGGFNGQISTDLYKGIQAAKSQNYLQPCGKTKTQIARDLGISDSALNKWCKEFGELGEEAFPGKGHQTSLEEENRRLRREVEVLRADPGNTKKSYGHLHAAPSVKYQFIYEYRHIYPIIRMCRVLGVSDNGYYNWLRRGKSQRKRDDEHLASQIEDAYHENRGVYGSPRIHAELKTRGIKCGRKRIARLMRERNISARRKRRQAKKQTAIIAHRSPLICWNEILPLMHLTKSG